MPTEQLGVPGDVVSGEITPEGDIYTGSAEYQLFYGSALHSWDQPTRTLPAPSVPLYEASLTSDGVLYTQQVFTIHVDGQPVVYMTVSARNSTGQPKLAKVALQVEFTRGSYIKGFHGFLTSPYRFERTPTAAAPGSFGHLSQLFDPAWAYSMQGRDLVRDGLLLARGPRAAQVLPTAVSTSPQAPHDKASCTETLAPEKSVAWTWQIPLAPPAQSAIAESELDSVPLNAARADLVSLWRRQESGMTQITVPEARVNQMYEANVAEILQSRYLSSSGWVQAVNLLQYEEYWIRDSAAETVALDDVALHTAAAENLVYLQAWQRPDGLYISRPGQQDGVGQALWEIDEHAQLTGSPAYAASQIPNVTAAVDWIAQASAADSMGLLPASTVEDDEWIVGGRGITGDDLWTAVGLRSAVALATLAGRGDLASAWQGLDNRFEAALDEAIDHAVVRAGYITAGIGRQQRERLGELQRLLPTADPRAHQPTGAGDSRARAVAIPGGDRHVRRLPAAHVPRLPDPRSRRAEPRQPRERAQRLYFEIAHTTPWIRLGGRPMGPASEPAEPRSARHVRRAVRDHAAQHDGPRQRERRRTPVRR